VSAEGGTGPGVERNMARWMAGIRTFGNVLDIALIAEASRYPFSTPRAQVTITRGHEGQVNMGGTAMTVSRGSQEARTREGQDVGNTYWVNFHVGVAGSASTIFTR
jgi:hypothetical protein